MSTYINIKNGYDTLEAKMAFEAFTTPKGVKGVHYHVDNSRFSVKKRTVYN